MAMPPERSRPLHNFTLPRLKWGNQRFLRCMKVNNANGQSSGANRRSPATEPQSNGVNRRRAANEVIKRRFPNATESFRKFPLKPIGAADTVRSSDSDQDGIEAVREKLMLDLRVAADRMKVSIIEEKEKDIDDSNSARPWNLRTRRAACKAPNEPGGGRAVNCNTSFPLGAESPMATAKSSRLRGLASAAATSSSRQSVEKEEKSQRPKFSISLSREEIESDFITMTGAKPPRRPKRRPKAVQRQLDTLLPGNWLSEITPETYKVPDFPESGKG